MLDNCERVNELAIANIGRNYFNPNLHSFVEYKEADCEYNSHVAQQSGIEQQRGFIGCWVVITQLEY